MAQQTVVVMVPQSSAAGTEGTAAGGEAVAQQVVVMPNGVPPEEATTRYSRTGFILFSIGVAGWNFLMLIAGLVFSFAPGEYGFIFFFTVFAPATTIFTMAIVDSTTHCNNPVGTAIKRICCCAYTGASYSMMVPVAVAAVLRFIFWCWAVGNVVDIFTDGTEGDDEADAFVDNIFFLFLSMAAYDVAPLVLMAIDFWYYYYKMDYEGIFGNKIAPLRCVFAQSGVILLICWSFVLFFNGIAKYLDDLENEIWQWIVHGVVSSIIFLIALWMHFGKQVEGAIAKEVWVRYLAMGCGVAQLIVVLLVVIDMLQVFGTLAEGGPWPLLLWLVFVAYYGGNSIPLAIALLSIKTEPVGNQAV